MTALAWTAVALAALPLALTFVNLFAFRRAPEPDAGGRGVSILLPARNEEAGIGAAVDAAAASRGVSVEIVVLDDESTDRTAAIVLERAAGDPRIRVERAPPLPPGWSGKQHACWHLARLARHELLLFVDADVRLAPEAAARGATFLRAKRVALASGFPREETATLAERLVVPAIHFLLLGYLPLPAARVFNWPAFGAGCGQLMLAEKAAYLAAGGHAAIRASMHDGLTLPRAFRRAGLRTDIFDAADLASCRMYRGGGEVWRGFSKNATEGMARPLALPLWTALLGIGHILPLFLLPFAPGPAALALALGVATRLCLAARFRQSLLGAVLHPLGIGVVLAIQWSALARALAGRGSAWRGRSYGKLTSRSSSAP